MEHKLGIIGFGGMGGWHEANVKRVNGLSVAAVYDIKEERVQLAESKGYKGYRRLEDFLKDDSIDLVLVSTPNVYHKELAIKALKAGKNVVVEKPATLNLAEFNEICEVADQEGKVFTVHQNRRWDKDYQMVKKTLEDQEIGEAYMIESRIHGKNGKFLEWRDKKAMGGGLILDWAPHLVDQILHLVPEKVTEVYAQLFSVVSQEVDDYFKLLLRFESGKGAMVEVGTLCLVDGPRWIVQAKGGSMRVDSFQGGGQIVKDKAHLAEWNSKIIETDRGPTRTMAPRPLETMEFKELPNVDDRTDWTEFYTNVMAAMEGKEELLVQHEDVRRVMAIIDEARKSSEEGMSRKVCI